MKSEREPAGLPMRHGDPHGGQTSFSLYTENERICLVAQAMSRGQQRDGGVHGLSRWKGASLGTVCGQHMR